MHNNIDENNYVYVKIINSIIYVYIYIWHIKREKERAKREVIDHE